MTKRPYHAIGCFFLLLFGLVVAGFTPRVPGTPFFGYFSHLAHFAHVASAIHLHAAAAVAWFVLLSVQPFLIRANRPDLHRVLGWSSVLVVAVFSMTAVRMMKLTYAESILQMPRDAALSLLAQSFTALTLFLAFYVLALLKRRKLHQHVAFLVAASLAVATPGLARLGLYVIGGLPSILLVIAFIYATLAGFMLHAKLRWQRPISSSPYLAAIALFVMAHAIDLAGSRTTAWLWLADKIVSIW